MKELTWSDVFEIVFAMVLFQKKNELTVANCVWLVDGWNRTILDELEMHDEAWPFLLPVNTKQFPTYKKIIRSPMDLGTIRKRLDDQLYKTRDDFCADLHLMFNNCVTFNEDESPVGKAGFSLKTYFDARWAELIAY